MPSSILRLTTTRQNEFSNPLYAVGGACHPAAVTSTADLTPRSGATVRALFPTTRSDLRVTWHADEDQFVVSMWRGGQCIGSAPLASSEAARLAAHIVTSLGERQPPSW